MAASVERNRDAHELTKMMYINSTLFISRLLALRTHPMTTDSSVGKLYEGISRLSGAGPFLARPLMS